MGRVDIHIHNRRTHDAPKTHGVHWMVNGHKATTASLHESASEAEREARRLNSGPVPEWRREANLKDPPREGHKRYEAHAL
jgi:hypothetical protein